MARRRSIMTTAPARIGWRPATSPLSSVYRTVTSRLKGFAQLPTPDTAGWYIRCDLRGTYPTTVSRGDSTLGRDSYGLAFLVLPGAASRLAMEAHSWLVVLGWDLLFWERVYGSGQ